jgi:serine/threonine-protein phosphatase 5
MCHIQILKPQLAVADLKKVLALEPQNAQIRKELESTQKLVRKIEFEKAIEVEEEKSAVDRCLEIIAEGASVSPCSSVLPRSRTTDEKVLARWRNLTRAQSSRRRTMANTRSQ